MCVTFPFYVDMFQRIPPHTITVTNPYIGLYVQVHLLSQGNNYIYCIWSLSLCCYLFIYSLLECLNTTCLKTKLHYLVSTTKERFFFQQLR